MRHHGQGVSRETLARDVWKETARTTPLDNVIDVHIARLRRKVDFEGVAKLKGCVHNVIPDRAVLRGTIRTLSPGRRQAVRADLERVHAEFAVAHPEIVDHDDRPLVMAEMEQVRA